MSGRLRGIGDRAISDKAILSLSSGNPLVDSSGTSKVISRDMGLFMSEGYSYILLFPICASLSGDVEGRYVDCRSYGVVCDGQYCGISTAAELISVFENMMARGVSFEALHIHHLIRNNLNRTLFVLSVFNILKVVVYLHDYYLLCPCALNLLDSESSPCGLVLSSSCEGCPLVPSRSRKLGRLRAFFEGLGADVVFIAPSKVPALLWKRFGSIPSSDVVVVPHQILQGVYDGNRESVGSVDRLTVGFVGSQREAKGWSLWKRIVSEVSREDYSFVQFGSGSEKSELFDQVPVFTHLQGKNAMVNALRKAGLEVALLLSNWPETYSYTAYECLASGAFVITLGNSGNIAEVVRERRCGVVCKNGEEVIGLLQDKLKLVSLINDCRSSGVVRPDSLLDNDSIVTFSGKEYRLLPSKEDEGTATFSSAVDKLACSFASRLYERKYGL